MNSLLQVNSKFGKKEFQRLLGNQNSWPLESELLIQTTLAVLVLRKVNLCKWQEKKCQKEEIKSNKNLTSTTYKVTYIKFSDVVVSNYSNEHYDMKYYILTIQNL